MDGGGLWPGWESEAEKRGEIRDIERCLDLGLWLSTGLDWLKRAGLERMGRMGSDHWLLDGRDWNGTGDRLVGAAAGHCTLQTRSNRWNGSAESER